MKGPHTRKMTFNLICPPTVNQFIFDGKGLVASKAGHAKG